MAYASWKPGAYGKEGEQYGKLERAAAIDRNAAIHSCSWGRGQIMGFNHPLVGYVSASAMVDAFMAPEANQVEAIVRFMASKWLGSHLRKIDGLKSPSTPDDWRPVALGYNGAGCEKSGYHTKLASRHNFWRTIPDTPWTPDAPAPTLTEDLPTVQPGVLTRFFSAFFRRLKGAARSRTSPHQGGSAFARNCHWRPCRNRGGCGARRAG